MIELQHTSTPWEATGSEEVITIKAVCPTQESADIVIAFIKPGWKNRRNANVKFILKACNNFDDLVGAIEEAIDGILWYNNGNGDISDVWDILRKALERIK